MSICAPPTGATKSIELHHTEGHAGLLMARRLARVIYDILEAIERIEEITRGKAAETPDV